MISCSAASPSLNHVVPSCRLHRRSGASPAMWPTPFGEFVALLDSSQYSREFAERPLMHEPQERLAVECRESFRSEAAGKIAVVLLELGFRRQCPAVRAAGRFPRAKYPQNADRIRPWSRPRAHQRRAVPPSGLSTTLSCRYRLSPGPRAAPAPAGDCRAMRRRSAYSSSWQDAVAPREVLVSRLGRTGPGIAPPRDNGYSFANGGRRFWLAFSAVSLARTMR